MKTTINKEFFEKWEDKKVVMWCKKEEYAREFCKLMHEQGLKWRGGGSYLVKTYWNNSEKEAAYAFNTGEFGGKTWDIYGYTILDFEDYIVKEKMTKQELVKLIVENFTNEDGNIGLCESGFHFCIDAVDCFNYYGFDSEKKVAEVVAAGLVETGDDKSVTNEITIVRELEWHEVLKLVNTGKGNSGYGNSGDRNSGDRNSGYGNSGNGNSGDWNLGDRNSGDRNSGDWNSGYGNSGYRNSGDGNSGYRNSGYGNSGDRNSGDRNSGYGNSGYRNSGDRNSGDRNSGDWNSGYGNSGDWNSGDWNSGNGNNGVFCTGEHTIKIFDEDTNMTLEDWRRTKAARILDNNFTLTEWVHLENMTDEEKEIYTDCEVLGGYLKTLSYKESTKNMWDRLTDEEKEIVKAIPNFDENKFKEITGIQI